MVCPRILSVLSVLAFAPACRDDGNHNNAGSTDAGSEDDTAGDSGDDGTPGACAAQGIGAAPLRRLTHREYDATVRDLLGDTSSPSRLLPTDVSANGFDTNASAQQIDALLAEGYMNAAQDLAARAVSDLDALLPCDPAMTGEIACGEQFIDAIGPRAFRRPLQADEVTRYRALLHDAHAAWGFDKAIELVLSALLQSPNFLFRLEFGLPDGTSDGLVPLSPYELAARLSYLLWGTMPDLLEPSIHPSQRGQQRMTLAHLFIAATANLRERGRIAASQDGRSRKGLQERRLGLGSHDAL